jgi:hypothetical protein
MNFEAHFENMSKSNYLNKYYADAECRIKAVKLSSKHYNASRAPSSVPTPKVIDINLDDLLDDAVAGGNTGENDNPTSEQVQRKKGKEAKKRKDAEDEADE